MKKTNYLLLSGLLILFVIACNTTSPVISNYEEGTRFSTYKTYQLLEAEDGLSYRLSSINRQFIEKAIRREMMVSGYTISPDPDFLVSYFVKEKLVEEKEINYQGYYKKSGFPLWENVREYKEGTLVIDLIDQKSNQIVWHGAIKREVEDNEGNLEEEINIAVKEVLGQLGKDVELSQKKSNID